jgi:hypothetical protein
LDYIIYGSNYSLNRNVLKSLGQLQDLLHIIDEAGFPGPKHKYVFNGDFVDRGPQSVEVMCVLLALFNAFPGKLFVR